jgi:hypothetical protein
MHRSGAHGITYVCRRTRWWYHHTSTSGTVYLFYSCQYFVWYILWYCTLHTTYYCATRLELIGRKSSTSSIRAKACDSLWCVHGRCDGKREKDLLLSLFSCVLLPIFFSLCAQLRDHNRGDTRHHKASQWSLTLFLPVTFLCLVVFIPYRINNHESSFLASQASLDRY